MNENRYSRLLLEAEESLEYWTESVILEFTEDLARVMDEQNISRAQLARRLGTSQAYITKILSGNANFTLATMTKLVRAINSILRVHIAPEGVITHWIDEVFIEQATEQSSVMAVDAENIAVFDAAYSEVGGGAPLQPQSLVWEN